MLCTRAGKEPRRLHPSLLLPGSVLLRKLLCHWEASQLRQRRLLCHWEASQLQQHRVRQRRLLCHWEASQLQQHR